jgi:hypothetical protein
MTEKKMFKLFICGFCALLMLAVSLKTALGYESAVFYRFSATLFYVESFVFFLGQFILMINDGKGGGPKYA